MDMAICTIPRANLLSKPKNQTTYNDFRPAY